MEKCRGGGKEEKRERERESMSALAVVHHTQISTLITAREHKNSREQNR